MCVVQLLLNGIIFNWKELLALTIKWVGLNTIPVLTCYVFGPALKTFFVGKNPPPPPFAKMEKKNPFYSHPFFTHPATPKTKFVFSLALVCNYSS